MTPTATAQEQQTLSRRQFLGLSALAAGGGLVAYSGFWDRHNLELREQIIRLRRLPEAFHGLRIAQISDIHYDEFTEPYFVREVVRRINALNPDIVLLTGDFVTDWPFVATRSQRASAIPAQRFSAASSARTASPRSAITTSWSAGQIVVDALKIHGIPTLVNSYLPFERDGSRLWFAGIRSSLEDVPDLDAAIPRQATPGEPIILLAHEPDYALHVVKHGGVDLMLSGHTHGGQVHLPFHWNPATHASRGRAPLYPWPLRHRPAAALREPRHRHRQAAGALPLPAGAYALHPAARRSINSAAEQPHGTEPRYHSIRTLECHGIDSELPLQPMPATAARSFEDPALAATSAADGCALRQALLLAAVFALLKFVLHLGANLWETHIGWGYFRDEMYYILCGRHLDWGYVDHGPIVALQARAAIALFGASLAGIRMFSALAGAAAVFLTGIIAWALGGGRSAQALAMLGILLAPEFLGLDSFLSMNSFEAVFWMAAVLAVLMLLRGAPSQRT